MTTHGRLLDALENRLCDFSALELVGLLVVARNELKRRGHHDAALLLDTAARAFAVDVSGPEGPSDNGSRAPGDNGAPA